MFKIRVVTSLLNVFEEFEVNAVPRVGENIALSAGEDWLKVTHIVHQLEGKIIIVFVKKNIAE